MPTEAQIQLYENKIAVRGQRRQARRPAVIAFRNLFGLMFLGAVTYGVPAIWVGAGNDNGPNDGGALWEDPMDFYILFGYIAFVALILVVKHSDGHKIPGALATREPRSKEAPGNTSLPSVPE